MSRLPPRRTVVVATLAAVLGIGCGLWFAGRDSDHGPGPAAPADSRAAATAAQPGDRLPSIVLPDLHGRELALASFQGRPLLINVWASWCGPCVEEMPALAAFAAGQGEQGVQVLGLALDTPEAVQAFLAQVPVGYPIVFDTPGPADASVLLGNTQGLLPYSVLVDARGRIVKQKLGPFENGEIEAWAQP